MSRQTRQGRAASRWVDVDRIKYWADNPNEGDVGAIMIGIQTFGWFGVVYLWIGYELRGGNHSIKALRACLSSGWMPHGDDIRVSKEGKVQVRFSDISHMTKQEADAFGISLNKLTRRGHDDPETVARLMVDIMKMPDLTRATGYEMDELQDIMVDFKPIAIPSMENLLGIEKSEGDAEVDHGPPRFLELYESDNDYGIPLLPLEAQATSLVEPVVKWGTIGREDLMEGTYHFYTDDYKFSGLVDRPDKLLTSQCKVAVEVNASTYVGMPLAIILGELYIKRWLSCYWAENGVKILVDLNVEPDIDDWNLLGVPDGWASYATRFIGGDLDHLQRCFEIGCDIAGHDDILFVVFGGTDEVKQVCQSNNWQHIPEHSALVRGYK